MLSDPEAWRDEPEISQKRDLPSEILGHKANLVPRAFSRSQAREKTLETRLT